MFMKVINETKSYEKPQVNAIKSIARATVMASAFIGALRVSTTTYGATNYYVNGAMRQDILKHETIEKQKVPMYFIPKHLYKGTWHSGLDQQNMPFSRYYKLGVENYKDAGSHPNTELNRMKQFALLLINMDRISHGIPPVNKVNIAAAQQHANSMFVKNYLSHWDTHDRLPYIRTALSGDLYGTNEDVVKTGNRHNNERNGNFAKSITNDLWQMMFHDGNSREGHRNDILNPYHTGVAIGLDGGGQFNIVAMDLEFVNQYVKWKKKPTFKNGILSFDGKLIDPSGVLNRFGGIAICYNKPLHYVSPETLNAEVANGKKAAYWFINKISGIDATAHVPYTQYKEGLHTNLSAKMLEQKFTRNIIKAKIDMSNPISKLGSGEYTMVIWMRGDESGIYAENVQNLPLIAEYVFIVKK